MEIKVQHFFFSPSDLWYYRCRMGYQGSWETAGNSTRVVCFLDRPKEIFLGPCLGGNVSGAAVDMGEGCRTKVLGTRARMIDSSSWGYLEQYRNHLRDLLKQFVGVQPQSFWFSRSRVGLESSLSQAILMLLVWRTHRPGASITAPTPVNFRLQQPLPLPLFLDAVSAPFHRHLECQDTPLSRP